MPVSPARRARVPRIALVLVGVLGLAQSSCSSTKFVYRMAPVMVMSVLDEACALTPAQKDIVRPRLREVLGWHRHEELPVYAMRMAELRARISDTDGVSTDDVKWMRETMDSIIDRAAQKLVPMAAEFVTMLEPAQVDRVEELGGKDRRRERAELLKLPVEQYVARQTRESVKAFEKWLGPATPEQRALISAFVRRTHDQRAAREVIETTRREQLFALVRKRLPASALRDAFFAMLAEARAVPAHSDAMAAYRADSEATLVQLFHLSTPTQRRHLDGELGALEEDMLELARD
jgi:hypothetical protein